MSRLIRTLIMRNVFRVRMHGEAQVISPKWKWQRLAPVIPGTRPAVAVGASRKPMTASGDWRSAISGLDRWLELRDNYMRAPESSITHEVPRRKPKGRRESRRYSTPAYFFLDRFTTKMVRTEMSGASLVVQCRIQVCRPRTEIGLTTEATESIARPRRPQPNLMEPQMNTDGHRLSPDPNSSIASPGAVLDVGLQDPDGLRTEAAERNNVAKTMILHACSTESGEGRDSAPYPPILCVLCGSISGLGCRTALEPMSEKSRLALSPKHEVQMTNQVRIPELELDIRVTRVWSPRPRSASAWSAISESESN